MVTPTTFYIEDLKELFKRARQAGHDLETINWLRVAVGLEPETEKVGENGT